MTNGNEPAYPAMDFNHREDGPGQLELRYNGMTKREYFAAMAMQGILGNFTTDERQELWESIATDSINAADALIAALTATNDLTVD